MRLCVMHNLYFYNQLMQRIRDALDQEFSAISAGNTPKSWQEEFDGIFLPGQLEAQFPAAPVIIRRSLKNLKLCTS